MSRFNEKIIKINSGVKLSQEGPILMAEGEKGRLSMTLPPSIKINIGPETIVVSCQEPNRDLFGLYASLVSNLIHGVSQGFSKSLEIIGLGYKAKKEGRSLILTLGFSHPIKFMPPEGCEIEVKEENKLLISGADKHLVGEVAAKIRRLKKPEPYKGKGIKYQGEVIKRKAGKTGKVGASA